METSMAGTGKGAPANRAILAGEGKVWNEANLA